MAGAPWCTLCYADLRAPVLAPAPGAAAPPLQAATQPEAAVQLAAATQPASAQPAPAGAVDLLDPAPARVAAASPPRLAEPTWPCPACGTSVPLERDQCPECATPFLAGADPVAALDLPLVGAVRPLALSKHSRGWLIVGGTLVVSLVLTAVFALIGLFL